MKEDHIQAMYLFLEGGLEPNAAREFEHQIQNDPQMKSDWHSFLVEQYLSGQLSGSWKAKIEKLRKEHPSFEKELSFQKGVYESLHLEARSNLKSEISSILPKTGLQVAYSGKRNSRKTYLLYLTAASIALLITLYIFRPQTKSPAELYAEYFEPYPMLLAERADQPAELRNLAIEAYQNENYKKALSYFSALRQDDPQTPLFLLYSGICELELGNTGQARKYFSKLRHPDYLEQRYWYEALSWLKEGNMDRTISMLKDISGDPGNYYSVPAGQLLNKLKV